MRLLAFTTLKGQKPNKTPDACARLYELCRAYVKITQKNVLFRDSHEERFQTLTPHFKNIHLPTEQGILQLLIHTNITNKPGQRMHLCKTTRWSEVGHITEYPLYSQRLQILISWSRNTDDFTFK